MGSMILGLAACGNTDVKSSNKKENMLEETVSEKAVVEDEKESKKDTPKKQDWYETDILTIQKVGKLEPLGEEESYTFENEYQKVLAKGNDYVDEPGKDMVCSWQGNPIGKSRNVEWFEDGYFVKREESIETWYNSEGEVCMENIGAFDYEQCNLSNLRYVFIEKEDKKQIFDRKEGRYVPNLPVIDDEYDVYTIGDNLWIDNDTSVDIYDYEGQLVKSIESTWEWSKGYFDYVCIAGDSGRTQIMYDGRECEITRWNVYDAEGNYLFSYDEDEYELIDGWKGHLLFRELKEELETSSSAKRAFLVDETGKILWELKDVDAQIYYNIACDIDHIYYFFNEKGIYYKANVKELGNESEEDCDYGIRNIHEIRYYVDGVCDVEMTYLNGKTETITGVVNPYVDAFYSKDGKLYSYVDGSVALDAGYQNYYYAYGRIYAENEDFSYDIFEILECNQPFEYIVSENFEELGSVAAEPSEIIQEAIEESENIEEVPVVGENAVKISERPMQEVTDFTVLPDINNGLLLYVPDETGTKLVCEPWDRGALSANFVIEEMVKREILPKGVRVEESIGKNPKEIRLNEEFFNYLLTLTPEEEEMVIASVAFSIGANSGYRNVILQYGWNEPLVTNNFNYDVPISPDYYYELFQ